ncbi:four helix bundle protein [Fulvivirga lutea]|uniref:Four helix bundle protein n=1 Tax=Fulvivirga lutea TaxID=2810512 RepID=A0A974WK68_9BACT|nr:four helix bundle protein [Fulvivirga lutea]QSE98722.1 four helix bundle protein [Fulvivirga lutea]
MELEKLNIYSISLDLAEEVYEKVMIWKHFDRDTIGKQLVRSADSIAANISEGFGRYHLNDSKKFYYYSRGSLFETKTWLTKANRRKLIGNDFYQEKINELEKLGKMLNAFITSMSKNMAKEPLEEYKINNQNTNNQNTNNQQPTTNNQQLRTKN